MIHFIVLYEQNFHKIFHSFTSREIISFCYLQSVTVEFQAGIEKYYLIMTGYVYVIYLLKMLSNPDGLELINLKNQIKCLFNVDDINVDGTVMVTRLLIIVCHDNRLSVHYHVI